MRRLLKRAAVLAAILVPTLAAVGFLLQSRRDAAIAAAHPPPGQFVDVGGHRLHYRLRGAGPITFVLEGGAGEYSGSWGEVADSLAGTGRVFTYDRAGLGWSEPGPRPRTLDRLADELHVALEAARIPRPHVFVGHSLGGAIVTRFAMRHSEDVAGLLLLDPSHPGQFERLSYPSAWQRWLATQATRLAPLGLSFVAFESRHPMKNRSTHLRTYGAELRAFMGFEGAGEANGAGRDSGGEDPPIDFGSIPVFVLTRDAPVPASAADPDGADSESAVRDRARWEAWAALHGELVAASAGDASRHVVVEGSGHCIHCDRPAAIVDAAADLADVVR